MAEVRYPQVGDIVKPTGIFSNIWGGQRAEVIKDGISAFNTNQIIVKLPNGPEHYINVNYVEVVFSKKRLKSFAEKEI